MWWMDRRTSEVLLSWYCKNNRYIIKKYSQFGFGRPVEVCQTDIAVARRVGIAWHRVTLVPEPSTEMSGPSCN